jgi:hypothetical protein
MDNYLIFKTTKNNIQIIGKVKAQSNAKAGKVCCFKVLKHGILRSL